MNKHPRFSTTLAFALATTVAAFAQSGGPFDLSWNSIDSGGGVNADGGSFALSGTIGQGQDAERPLASGSFVLQGGFMVIARDLADDCPGDATGDGFVNADDLLVVLGNFGVAVAGGVADGDFDDSGTVNADDLLVVLGAFGTAC